MPSSAAESESTPGSKAQHNRVECWLERRFPDVAEITLGLRTIFIVPTMTSIALLLTVMLLFLMAINFQNALIYGLSFWLLALLVVSIFFTYRNLSGLTLKAIQSSPCFVGEKAVFECQVSVPADQKKAAIFIGWKDEDMAEASFNQEQHQEHQKQQGKRQRVSNHSLRIKLSHSTTQRGWFKPPRLSVFTRYPVGLMVSWSYAALDMQSIVFPAPLLQKSVTGKQDSNDNNDQAEQGTEIANGSTDFSGIREYQPGDSPKHIHWGTYAKTGEVYTKSFVDYGSNDLWLNWDTLNIQGVETKLSHLCARVLECHQEQLTYGLKLPANTLQPDSGEAHKNLCLTALALYGMDVERESR